MPRTFRRPDPDAPQRCIRREADTAAGLILALAWLAGLTRAEIQLLEWPQADLTAGELVLPNRRVPLCPQLWQLLSDRARRDRRSPQVVSADRTGKPLHPVYLSRLARTALEEEPSLRGVQLMDLRYDFILRELETHDWAWVARVSGYTVTAFQSQFSPYIKIKHLEQRELQGDDEYRLWRVLQGEKGSMEGLALSLRWYLDLSLSELTELTWDQVDLENGVLRLPDRETLIPLTLRRELRSARERRGADPHVLLKPRAGTPLDGSYLSRRVRTVLLKYGVDDILFRDVCRQPPKRGEKEQLVALAGEMPGFSRADAAARLELSQAALYRRLRELVGEGRLVRVGSMYYLPGTVVPEEEQMDVIGAYLAREGSATAAQLRLLLRTERRQCARALKKFTEQGALRREGDRYFLPERETANR